MSTRDGSGTSEETRPPALVVTFGTYTQSTPWTDVRALAWPTLADLLTHHQVGPKEGTCIVPAVFRGTERKKDQAQRIDIVMLDSDGGATLDEIRYAVRERGWSAIISSTHSHLTATTRAKRSIWEKFLARADDPMTAAETFLIAEKNYLGRVATGAHIVNQSGEFITFRHQPCPKFRVVLLLYRPWRAADYSSQEAANAAWKACIEALAAALGLDHDQSCTDTSRLFYLPRRPADGPPPETAVIDGTPCDIFALPPAPPLPGDASSSSRPSGAGGATAEPFLYADKKGNEFDLFAWAKGYGDRFEIVTALKSRRPDAFVDHVIESKYHIRCPNEDSHTNAGKDTATFCANASESRNEGGFVIHCRHAHCTGYDRLQFLRQMLEQDWLTVADLTDPQHRSADGAVADQRVDARPDPVDFLADPDLTGVPILTRGHVPDVIYDFAIDTAERMGVDPVSVALIGIVTCASVMDEEFRLQPKMHDTTWLEESRLWAGIVGDPSILKTPVIRACTRPIDRLDAAGREQHVADMATYQHNLKNWEEHEKDVDTKPSTPRMPRYLVESTTVEALSEVLRDDAGARYTAPAKRVLLRQDELGEWIASFDRYKAGGRGGSDRGAFLRLYNGGRHVVDRVGRGSFAIPNWSACIVGGIQPEVIQRIAHESADDGLLQRFILCVPVACGSGQDRAPDRSDLKRYDALFSALTVLHPQGVSNCQGHESPSDQEMHVVLHADAHKHRIAIDSQARAVAALPDTSSRLRAAFGKWPGLFARLALALHLIEIADARAQGRLPPTLNVVSIAVAAMTERFMRDILLPHTLRADAVMFASVQTGHARWIASYILAHGCTRITRRDVVQSYGALRASEHRRVLLEVMESLVTVGWLEPEEGRIPGRDPTAWLVNPAVHTLFAERAKVEKDRRDEARLAVKATVSRMRGRTA